MVNEFNNHQSNHNDSQTQPMSFSSSAPIFLRSMEPITRPSILLKSHSTFNCSDNSREKKTQCKFDQLTCAFKKVLVSFRPCEHRLNGTGLLYPKPNDDGQTSYSKSKFKTNQKRSLGEDKKLDERKSETYLKQPNLPSIKFAPLPKINNRRKKSNTISMGVSARSQLIQQMKKQEQDLISKRCSLPIQEPIQWTNPSQCIKSEKDVVTQSENKVRRRQKKSREFIKRFIYTSE